MRCQALVTRKYSEAGRCAKTQNVKVIRWAPTELRTQVILLCPCHKAFIERHGEVPTFQARGPRPVTRGMSGFTKSGKTPASRLTLEVR